MFGKYKNQNQIVKGMTIVIMDKLNTININIIIPTISKYSNVELASIKNLACEETK